MKKSKLFFFIIIFLTNIFFSSFFGVKISFQETAIIHVFLFSLMLLTENIQLKIANKKKVISYFLILNFARMFLCFLFLAPIIFSYEKTKDIYIYNFFIIYFLYLFYSLKFKQKKVNKINA